MPMTFGDIDLSKFTKSEIRDKFVEEYKKIYSRKYRRAHYKNKWVKATDNHTAEEDFKLWVAESKLIMRKHKVGLITDREMKDYILKWIEQDIMIKQLIDELSIPKDREVGK